MEDGNDHADADDAGVRGGSQRRRHHRNDAAGRVRGFSLYRDAAGLTLWGPAWPDPMKPTLS